jgi:hypothetical protein
VEAEREVEKALALDQKSGSALLISFMAALLDRDGARARTRQRELEEHGLRREISTARGFIAIARRDQGYRFAVAVFEAGKDPLAKAIVKTLLAREPLPLAKPR